MAYDGQFRLSAAVVTPVTSKRVAGFAVASPAIFVA